MKTIKISLLLTLFTVFLLGACKNSTSKKEAKVVTVTQAAAEKTVIEQKTFPVTFEGLVFSYLAMKDALVADNSVAAAQEAAQFNSILEKLEASAGDEATQELLQTTAPSMKEHAQGIANGDMAQQREHLELLTDDIIATVNVTGFSQTLYQQYCPMYKGNEGGIWLSANQEIRNPLFGSKMLKCGVIQTEIN